LSALFVLALLISRQTDKKKFSRERVSAPEWPTARQRLLSGSLCVANKTISRLQFYSARSVRRSQRERTDRADRTDSCTSNSIRRDFLHLLHFDAPTREKMSRKITSSLLLSLTSSSCSSSLLLFSWPFCCGLLASEIWSSTLSTVVDIVPSEYLKHAKHHLKSVQRWQIQCR